MRVERLEPDRVIAWLCQGDFPYWAGTRVTWEMQPSPIPGETTLTFSQTGWPTDYPPEAFGQVNFTWGQIVARLKAYAESGQPQPYFPASVASGV